MTSTFYRSMSSKSCPQDAAAALAALGVPGPVSAVRPACGAMMAALRQQFGQIIISAKSLNVNIQ